MEKLKKVLHKAAPIFNRISGAVKTFLNKHSQRYIAIMIVVMGLILAVLLVVTKKSPDKVEPLSVSPLVEIQKVATQDVQMVVTGYGTINPKVDVEIVPQISGQVVWVNENFRDGGFIKAGENLFRIEPKDFELKLQQAQATVAEAQVKLDMEIAEAEVAVKEWQQLHPGTEPDSALVLRKPQIRQAQAQLTSAKAAQAKAKLDLDRTNITLPIDICVSSKLLDLGQFVTVGKTAGKAYGIDTMEVQLQIKDDELKWFDISNESSETVVEVVADFAGEKKTWDGFVKRTTGEIDRNSRMVGVVVEIKESFHSVNQNQRLIPGMFVEVNIKGKLLKDAIVIPRRGLRNGGDVWVVKDGVLDIKPLGIARVDNDFVYVSSGLQDGDEIVVSSIDKVVDKMSVRVLE